MFVEKYQQMHRWRREPDGTMTLYIGAENWPFPIPLVERNGAWRFDGDAGAQEIMFRRIGENELTAIAACHEFVAAEMRYRATSNTANLMATAPSSLVASVANGTSGSTPVLVNGYYFRAVASPGPARFLLIAYPAEYRVSGVVTFAVTGSGIVYEKDLGPNTTASATAMTEFQKDATWRIAGQ